jgi:hypothetical protein
MVGGSASRLGNFMAICESCNAKVVVQEFRGSRCEICRCIKMRWWEQHLVPLRYEITSEVAGRMFSLEKLARLGCVGTTMSVPRQRVQGTS